MELLLVALHNWGSGDCSAKGKALQEVTMSNVSGVSCISKLSADPYLVNICPEVAQGTLSRLINCPASHNSSSQHKHAEHTKCDQQVLGCVLAPVEVLVQLPPQKVVCAADKLTP